MLDWSLRFQQLAEVEKCGCRTFSKPTRREILYSYPLQRTNDQGGTFGDSDRITDQYQALWSTLSKDLPEAVRKKIICEDLAFRHGEEVYVDSPVTAIQK